MRPYTSLVFSFLIFSFTLFFSGKLLSQDTTIVQTFTWDSTSRSAYFDFPTEDKSYEKIQMIYNMRCFDAAVGNGSVGCKEWDYSCNTFLYVPEKQDSSIAFKYNYDVSQISDDYFAYTTEEHYTYYAFDQVFTDYDKINSEHEIEIASSNPVIQSFDASKAGKIQMLYLAQELMDAGFQEGHIDGLAFDFSNPLPLLRSARIKLKNIEEEILNINNVHSTSLNEVYFRDTEIASSGFTRFNFHTPFEWDGISNILVELSFDESPQDIQFVASDLASNCVSTFKEEGQKHALEFGGSWGIEPDPTAFESVKDEVSVAFWTFGRPMDLPSRNTSIFEAYDANNRRTMNVHLPWSNAGIYWDCGNNGGSVDRINKTATYEDFRSQWNFWAFTKNNNTGSMKIYLNGKLWHSGENKTRPIDIKKFRLGSSTPHGNGYYGMLDEFSFWNKELDEASIATIMNKSIDASHPDYSNLVAYYNFESGSGNTIIDGSSLQKNIQFEGGPAWRNMTGKDLRHNFKSENLRPNITFYSGSYNIDQSSTQVLDTVVTPQHSVLQYEVHGSSLVAVDTFFLWEAEDSKVINEAGEEIDNHYVEIEDFILFEELHYYNFKDAKFELISLVTPYGNGLDLGPEGKTFTFDVSDFEPILKGNKRLSIEMGGQTQEQLDIKFLFIEGTPSRDVVDIQNIWPFARGYYTPIQDDRIFERRSVQIPSNVSQVKVRSSVTGHGQNGEFQQRDHRISLNGNAKQLNYKVWKECSYNPIYPQGGTWIYDRAGWCPGMATDVHEFDISDFANAGSSVDLDYNVLGAVMTQANYLVSNQIVYYGNPNFTLDAAVDRIVRPNMEAVEFARFNPLCSDPAVIIKNNGSQKLTSLKIIYGIEGISEKSHTWTGSLGFLETEEVYLPVDNLGFYGTEEENVFYVRIEAPNGGSDEYVNNNIAHSKYKMTDVYEGYERWLLRVRTNNKGYENEYSLIDQNGNVILERKNLENNTTYDDEITLPAGCYSFEISDKGNDGLYFWNNPGAGSGWVSIRRIVNETISFEKIKFESDFGGVFNYDFIIDESTSTENFNQVERVSLYPNPGLNYINIEAIGLEGEKLICRVVSMDGVKQFEKKIVNNEQDLKQQLDISDLPPGTYTLSLQSEGSVWVRSFIKM